MSLWLYVAALAALVLGYLIKLNAAMSSTPSEGQQASPRRWTKAEIRETYAKLDEQPVDFNSHLPPKLDRRYVVVGASGTQVRPATVIDIMASRLQLLV